MMSRPGECEHGVKYAIDKCCLICAYAPYPIEIITIKENEMAYKKAMTAVEARNMTEDNVKRRNIIEDLMNEVFTSISNACKKGDTECVYVFNSEQDDQPIIDFCREELNNLGFRVEHDQAGSELLVMWGSE